MRKKARATRTNHRKEGSESSPNNQEYECTKTRKNGPPKSDLSLTESKNLQSDKKNGPELPTPLLQNTCWGGEGAKKTDSSAPSGRVTSEKFPIVRLRRIGGNRAPARTKQKMNPRPPAVRHVLSIAGKRNSPPKKGESEGGGEDQGVHREK